MIMGGLYIGRSPKTMVFPYLTTAASRPPVQASEWYGRPKETNQFNWRATEKLLR